VAIPPFQEDYSSPADQAWRSGASPYAGTLGPNRTADTLKNTFAAKLKKNPDYANFYSSTFPEAAPQSQSKIDAAASNDSPNFENPGDQSFAQNFLNSYKQGVMRGLIEEDRAVSSANLARLTTESAAQGSNERDPNTASQFPGQGGIKI
jgi:hypothetical protein